MVFIIRIVRGIIENKATKWFYLSSDLICFPKCIAFSWVEIIILDRERPVGGSGNNNDGIALRQVHFAASASSTSNGDGVMTTPNTLAPPSQQSSVSFNQKSCLYLLCSNLTLWGSDSLYFIFQGWHKVDFITTIKRKR